MSFNREEWLSECMGKLRPWFADISAPLPKRIRASCSWPSVKALSRKNRRIGEAWSSDCSGDGSCEVFISPALKEPAKVSATLVHELVHCAVGVECGHKGRFRAVAEAIGLEGKMTETIASVALAERLHAITQAIGMYPHAELTASNAPKKQTTRMIKVECLGCGCVVRMTRKWLDEVGPPTCGCGDLMEQKQQE